MANMTASVPHRLTRAEAKRRIQEQIGILREQHGALFTSLRETWSEDELDFAVMAMGNSITGRLTVDDTMVHLVVTMPWLLSMLAKGIKKKVEQQGAILLRS